MTTPTLLSRGEKHMELETINKLFLELSQVTTATIARELAQKTELDHLRAVIAAGKDDAERLESE